MIEYIDQMSLNETLKTFSNKIIDERHVIFNKNKYIIIDKKLDFRKLANSEFSMNKKTKK